MNDFADGDYLTKNIRVMPMAGSMYDQQSEQTSKHHPMVGSIGRGEESEYEESKMNNEIKMEIKDTRKAVKERFEEEQRKARELAEKLAKKNKK